MPKTFKIRPFKKPTEIEMNFDAQEYSDMLKLDKIKLTESPATFDLTDSDLEKIESGEMTFKLPHVYCHTQVTERAVSNTTLASKTVVGRANRHGFLLTLQDSRQKFGKEVRTSDFLRLHGTPESDT